MYLLITLFAFIVNFRYARETDKFTVSERCFNFRTVIKQEQQKTAHTMFMFLMCQKKIPAQNNINGIVNAKVHKKAWLQLHLK